MSRYHLLGVDIGAYESKGVIAPVDGRIVSSQVKPHGMSIPRQGWAEHDAEAVWWGDFVAITRRLLVATGINPKDLAGIACSSIAPDVLPVDAECRPLRTGGILYGVDTRAAQEIAELDVAPGVDAIFAKAGNSLSAQTSGPKILWLKHHEPDVYRRAYVTVGTSDAAAEAVSVCVTAPGPMMLMYGSTIFLIEVLDQALTDRRLWAAPYLLRVPLRCSRACPPVARSRVGCAICWLRIW